VKIVSFAHVTFVPPTTSDSNYSRFNQTPLVSQYVNVPNNPSKLKFMRGNSKFHNISIFDDSFRVEIISYQDIGNALQIYGTQFKQGGCEIASASFKINLLRYISYFLTKKQSNEKTLQIPTGPFREDVVLRHDEGGIKFEEFLDDPGFVALAFYVDQLDALNLDSKAVFLPGYDRSDVFDIVLDGIVYKICIARVEGVYLEFIERVKVRNS
jgi:hypothetical protein